MKKNLLPSIFLCISSVFSFIFSMILYFQSFEKYSDEYGSDISFNEDYMIAIFVSICLLIYGIYKIYLITNFKESKNAYGYCGSLICCLISFYSLGVLFKNLNKGKPFADSILYFYIGIFTLFLLVYFILHIVLKKENKKD